MATPKFTVTTELFIDGAWVDISSDVRLADGVQISRGRPDQTDTADPSSCTLTLNNRDGKYSPRNPMSPYYGKIGRNTPIRVVAESKSRFYGEVSAWPQRWDKSGNDVWVPLQAYGPTRRLGQGAASLRSVMYRGVTALDSVVAYWPCEDGGNATEFASALPGHPAMQPYSGLPDFASFDGFSASEPLPLMVGSRWIAPVPTYPSTGTSEVTFLLAIPAGGVASTAGVMRVRSAGGASRWDLDVNTSGSLRMRVFDTDDTMIHDSGFVAFTVNGRLLRLTLQFEHLGADINWEVQALEAGDLFPYASMSGTVTGRVFNRIVRIGVNIGETVDVLDDVAVGHVTVRDELSPGNALAGLELRAYDGEWAGTRLQRLCSEEGVGLTTGVANGVQETASMGPQLPGNFLDLLAEAAEADMGILFESRSQLGLYYRTRASLYAQSATLTLDYAAGTVSGIEPTEDDDATRNDITVTRVNGSSARAQRESGPLSVNAPPDGVGRYDAGVTVSIERDEDLADQAGWRLHLGTVDEARYPVIGVNLASSAFTSDAGLTADAQELDIGDRLVITGAPSTTTSPDDIQQIVQGFTETLGQYEWLIDVNCTPASPWDVGRWNDSTGPGEARYSSDGTTLVAGAALLLNGTAPGRAFTPDAASLDITGDIDIRVHVAMDDWTPISTQCLVSKNDNTGQQRAWQLNINSAGRPVLITSVTGIATLTNTCTASPTVTNGEALWVRATLDVDNGSSQRVYRYYTSVDGVTWTQLGSTSTVSGTTSIFNSTANVVVGSIDAGATNRLAGRVFAVEVRSGIDGTVVANPVFSEQTPGATSFEDDAGNTWTITSPAELDGDVILVDTPTGPVWGSDDLPYDLAFGGERVTITAITGTGRIQAMTATRSVNGIIKGHVQGTEVGLFKPAIYAL